MVPTQPAARRAPGTVAWLPMAGVVPESCSLPLVEQPLRIAEFDELFATAVAPAQRLSPTVLRLHLPAGEATAATVRDLTVRETACCSFFSFDVLATTEETELVVRVPEAQTAVLDAVARRAATARG